eukprot:4556402-Amphidinium_carterae.2
MAPKGRACQPSGGTISGSASHGNLADTLAGNSGKGLVDRFERGLQDLSRPWGVSLPPTCDQAAGSSSTAVPPDDPRLLDATADEGGHEEIAHTVPGSTAALPDLPAGITTSEFEGAPCFWCVCGQQRAINWEPQFMREHIILSTV